MYIFHWWNTTKVRVITPGILITILKSNSDQGGIKGYPLDSFDVQPSHTNDQHTYGSTVSMTCNFFSFLNF